MAASSGLSEKPHFLVSQSPSQIKKISSKSQPNSLCKALIIVLLLLLIPLFPSQAPDFISPDFWEIIHLLFIGIAISYGLFSRKSDGIVLNSRTNDDSQAYFSGISHLSSIFEDGFENLCGVDDGKDVRSSVDENDNLKYVNCSQYVKEESLVVVSNGKYFGGGSDFKPLNLPVRSLRSIIVDNNDKHNFSNVIEESHRTDDVRNMTLDNDRADFKDSPMVQDKIHKNNDDETKVLKIKDVAPTNLEKKFEETSGFSSLTWRSRSRRMRKGEGTSSNSRPRPHSVGEFEFENLKSRSVIGPEFAVSKGEGSGMFSVSRAKVAPLDDEASSCEYNSSDHGNEEEKVEERKQALEPLNLNTTKSCSGLAKVVSRAKSVRTVKPRSRCNVNKKWEGHSLVKRGSGREVEINPPPLNHQSEEVDSIFPKPKPEPTLIEDNGSDSDKSLEDVRTNEGSEVDRKADEFIAKFREQIRLQKVSYAAANNW